MSAFDKLRRHAVDRVTEQLEALLAVPDGPEKQLFEAMRYSALDGGKGFRPFLVLATAKLFKVTEAHAVRAAAAVECVHCYSLIHDDLPAMDDDDMRRGRPSLHKAYDEATAILAGDALLTLAFELLADEATHADAEVRARLVAGLAKAAGMRGMVGGQMMDMLSPDLALDAGGLTRLQKMKTGALISFAVEAGAALGKAGTRRSMRWSIMRMISGWPFRSMMMCWMSKGRAPRSASRPARMRPAARSLSPRCSAPSGRGRRRGCWSIKPSIIWTFSAPRPMRCDKLPSL